MSINIVVSKQQLVRKHTMILLNIKNYKISIKIDQELTPRIIKKKNLLFTIYKTKKNLINITGISSLRKLDLIKKIISSWCFNKPKIFYIRKDAIFLNFKQNKSFHIERLIEQIKKQKPILFRFEPEIWSAIVCKFSIDLPNVIFFRTGTIQVLGINNLKQIHAINKITNLIFDSL